MGRCAGADQCAGEAGVRCGVKPDKSGDRPISDFPLGPGNVYVPNGGFFSAKGFPLITYISFAYKLMGNQTQFLLPQLPGWVTSEPFDIQARAEGNPSKDEMRLMMRSLLADRFRLAIHNETREVPVLALVLAKPGKTGPHLVPHPDGAECPTNLSPGYNDETVAGGFPVLCGGLLGQPPSEPGRMRVGARNVTLGFVANALSGGAGQGRPMLDQTASQERSISRWNGRPRRAARRRRARISRPSQTDRPSRRRSRSNSD
jgi:uncharacterized protein (TIGR03435 family)